MLTLTETTLGGLYCRVLDGSGRDGPPTSVVVLCHGYGAPGDDLVSLGGFFYERAPELLATTRFVFPEAPHAADGAPMGRAWWQLDMAQIQLAMMRGEKRTMRDAIPNGLPEARKKLRAMLDELLTMTKLPVSRIVLGGFSQGAMASCELALSLDEAPGGLIQFSGTLLCAERWQTMAKRRAGLPVVQSHGRQDPLLNYGEAEGLRDLLTEAGLTVEFVPFDGGHEIPLPALSAAETLVNAVCLAQ